MKNEKAEDIREGGGCGCTSSCGEGSLNTNKAVNLDAREHLKESKDVPQGSMKGSGEDRPLNDKQIRKTAYSHFESGLHCAEVVSKIVLDLFSGDPGEDAVRCASGFGGGIAGSMEGLCGAFTGGIVAAGYMLGRETPGDSLKDCANLIGRFRSSFLEEFGSIQCPELIKGFREQKNPSGCVKLTATAAVMLANLINDSDLGTRCREAKEKIKPVCCPFTGRQYVNEAA